MERKFKSIKIIHDIIHRADYNYVSEFFRMFGILVCEGIIIDKEQKTEAEKNTEYDVYIYVGEREMPAEDAGSLLNQIVDREEYVKSIDDLPQGTIFLYDLLKPLKEERGEISDGSIVPLFRKLEKEKQVSFLSRLMEIILGRLFEKAERERYDFSGLINIYVNNDLVLHAINLQYFPRRESDALREAQGAFMLAQEALRGILWKNNNIKDEGKSYYQYALIWIKLKADQAGDFSGGEIPFSEKELISACKELCEEYPDFSNAKILCGLCYEPFHNRFRAPVYFFKEALSEVKDECFASPVCYWLGKKYETDGRDLESMKMYYEMANEKKRKFRIIFKLAIIARNEKQYAEALGLFDEIINRLCSKRKIGYTDPLEIEYLFKSYNQKCFIYYWTQKYRKSIEMGEAAKEIIKKEIAENRFFEIFYGKEKADVYRKILWGRLSLRNIDDYEKKANKRLSV